MKKPSTAKTEVATKEQTDLNRARMALRPSMNNAAVAAEYGDIYGEQNIPVLIAELNERTQKLEDDNLEGVEAMLYGQAHALQSIFTNLARRAHKQEYLKQYGIYLTLALKAQAQCRATLETLAEVKYPKSATFVKQQNNAYQQQVNNGNVETSMRTPAPAHGKTINEANELLTEDKHAPLDSRRTATPSNVNQAMETVAAVNRSEDSRGEA